MLKSARDTTPDPIQMKLRQNKKLWNKDVSTFINDLIHFKKTLNGSPSKFFQEKGNIKNPIPADPATIIGVLASDFQEIVQKGNAIIEEQINYSKNRRKSQPGFPDAPATPATPAAPPVTPPVTPDLSKQLAAFESKYEMVAEGSNFLSRFIARLTSPTIGFSRAADIRRARMSLLDASVKAYKDLEKLQVTVVKSSKDSIHESNKILHDVWNNWTLVSRGFNAYKQTLPPVVEDAGGEIPPSQDRVEEKTKEKKKALQKAEEPEEQLPDDPNAPAPGDYDHEKPPGGPPTQPSDTSEIRNMMSGAAAAISDYAKNYQKLNSDDMGGYDGLLESAITKFRYVKGPFKPAAAKVIIDEYSHVIQNLNRSLGTNGTTMADIFKQLKTKEVAKKVVPTPIVPDANKTLVAPVQASAQLESVAQAFLKKWVGKTLHKLNPFDKTSGARISIYDMADNTRTLLNQIMDSLEKGMNVDELGQLISETNKSMTSLRGLMRSLHLSNPTPKDNKNMGFLDRMTKIEELM
jgi:hypothetical protein